MGAGASPTFWVVAPGRLSERGEGLREGKDGCGREPGAGHGVGDNGGSSLSLGEALCPVLGIEMNSVCVCECVCVCVCVCVQMWKQTSSQCSMPLNTEVAYTRCGCCIDGEAMILSGGHEVPHSVPGEVVTSPPACLYPLLTSALPVSTLGALVASPHLSAVPAIIGLPALLQPILHAAARVTTFQKCTPNPSPSPEIPPLAWTMVQDPLA